MKRAEIFRTPEHDEVKKRKCAKQAEIFGIPEHDEIKKKKRDKYKMHEKNSLERISKESRKNPGSIFSIV